MTLIVFVFLIGFIEGLFLTITGLQNSYEKADLIVVFGNEVKLDGSLSDRLKARLDKAVELFEEKYSDKILVSGGIGKEGFDEAEKMKEYLEKRKIPGIDILQDNQGVNTFATAQNAALLMRKNSLTSVILVSQFFHMARARVAFEKVGVKEIHLAHADFFELRDFYSLLREIFAYNAYLLK